MAIDYTDLALVKSYMDIEETNTDDDALIEVLITASSRQIDDFTGRWFYGEEQTRYFDAVQDVKDYTLYLDQDLTEITEIMNGNNTEVQSTSYILNSPNLTPYWGITLKRSSGVVWTWLLDPENAIEVTGVWGYVNGSVPPAEITLAATRLTAWRYKQRSAPFNTVGLPEMNQVIVPAAIPEDVAKLLGKYVRYNKPG